VIDWDTAVQTALESANDPESHVERDAETFHPSQIAYQCNRRAYCSKLGLDDNSDILGIFQTGTLIHEFLEDRLDEQYPYLQLEREVELETDGVRFTGRCDAHDPQSGVVYDFKTRSSWYNFDPPNDRHVDQLHVYMAALGARHGQVVYISKSDMEVRTWPEDRWFDFDHDRWADVVDRAETIRDAICEHGIPDDPEDIPFEPCGCYFCDEETLELGGEAE
jgi:hypothetical protein